DTMKNSTRTSSTSTSETTLTSGSSFARVLSLIGHSQEIRPVVLRQRVEKLDRLLLHLHHEPVDLAAQIAVADQSRNRDDQARRGRDQRLGDAARKHRRIADALGRDCR